MWQQFEIQLAPRRRGYHLVTDEIVSACRELSKIDVGLMHLFMLHTSAGIGINENADPDVRTDLEPMMNRIVPEGQSIQHTIEGPDDMPAHVKSLLVGCQLTIPINRGRLRLGTWQGIYLCEFRNQQHARSIVVTLHGEERSKT